MNLEDHLGDIVRKARLSRNVATADAAQAAGLTESELASMEESGIPGERVNFPALARLTGLDAKKLQGVAEGWMPAQTDIGRWREFRMITTTGDGMTVNCYLIWDEVTRDAALFDTGWEAEPILKLIAENKLELRHIFITHSHTDHIAALGVIREKFSKAILHTDAKSAPPQHKNRRNDCIQLGSLRIMNRETPGHAEDGVTYVVGNWPEDAPHVAIVGDAIFAASMGRGNQSWDLARQKVRENILTLPVETMICPGHGPLTSVGQEQANNPFF
ncbi:MAG: MBL fold metallo-hydrolase [Opitutaceae bacterium]|nr:MBL fold metallo-hydrolase [Verrucomicrobiales bacterium]